jgi:hypothetical protein
MRHVPAAAVLVTALLLPAGAADAAVPWSPGSYSGETSGGQDVSFSATKKKVVDFAFSDIPVVCTDGVARVAGQRGSDPISIKKSRKNGKFAFANGKYGTTPAQFGFATKVNGTLKKKKASGTLRVYYRTSPDGGLSEDGSVECESAPIRWKASTF